MLSSGQDWDAERQDCKDAVLETKRCMVLNNYYWGVWAVMMLADEDLLNVNAFNWEFFKGRCEMHKYSVEKFGFGKI